MHFLWITIPTLFTLVRLFVSPLLMPLLIAYVLPAQRLSYNIGVATIFGLLGFTDFLDGYTARYFGWESELGRMLDPLADKILVSSTCIALVAIQRLSVFGALVFIGREFFVMALREATLVYGISVPVMMAGKIKTVMQMVYLIIVLLNTRLAVVWQLQLLERCLYIATLILTILSALIYYSYGLQQLALR